VTYRIERIAPARLSRSRSPLQFRNRVRADSTPADTAPMETVMTKTAALFATATILVLAAAPAQARDYPYCLQGGDWGYPGNCNFTSYQQCMITASGTRAGCGVNPVFAFGAQRGPQPRPLYYPR
jgi:hypothetical protein